MHALSLMRKHSYATVHAMFAICHRMHAYNHTSMVLLIIVAACGLLMLASASVYESMKYFDWPYMYFTRQLGSLVLALGLFMVVYMTSVRFWYKTCPVTGGRDGDYTLALSAARRCE